ncbi:MAG TPA: hypothetical protein VIL55_08905 [Naasia sp.]|jgi:hypothetical protein
MSSTITSNRADAVGAVFAEVLTRLERWREALAAAEFDRSARLDAVVEALVAPALAERSTLLVGAGFIAAPGVLDDVDLHLAWWLGKYNTLGLTAAEPAVRRLRSVDDPESEDFHDYTFMEWWRVPAETRIAHLTGPYVDYLCTDDYTVTLTVPVEREGRLLGLVGADLYVRDVEAVLLPALTPDSGVLTLINRSGRVIVSSDPHLPTGVVLRDTETAAIPVAWGGTPLRLVARS